MVQLVGSPNHDRIPVQGNVSPGNLSMWNRAGAVYQPAPSEDYNHVILAPHTTLASIYPCSELFTQDREYAELFYKTILLSDVHTDVNLINSGLTTHTQFIRNGNLENVDEGFQQIKEVDLPSDLYNLDFVQFRSTIEAINRILYICCEPYNTSEATWLRHSYFRT